MGPAKADLLKLVARSYIWPSFGGVCDLSAPSLTSMRPTTLQLIALGLEFLGTLLLAAEAIKLYNLHLVRRMGVVGNFAGSGPSASRLHVGHSNRALWGLYGGIFILFAVVLADAVLLLRGFSISAPLASFRSFVPGQFFIDILVSPPSALVVFVTVDFFGLFLIEVLAFPLLLTMVLLKVWERHSGSGAIGVMGFVFLLTGTSLRVYLDWLSA